MKFLTFILILNLVLIESISCQQNDETLKAMFVINRHGDRATSYSYPNDPYFGNLTIWPNGLGQLTEKGMRRMFNIGEFLRKTYDEFLGDSIRDVEVRSTDRDRCLESAQLIVGAAYPPTGRWIWTDDGENWQPVPVHTMPMPDDKLLYPFPICPKADEEISRVFNEGGGKMINETNKEFYKFLSEKSGTEIEAITQASDLYDILMNEKGIDLPLPDWANETVLDRLLQLHTQKFRLFAKTRKLQRFRVGLLLNEIMEHSEKAIAAANFGKPAPTGDDEGVKKVYVYSTHDIFLTILMTALQVDNGINPPFGSAKLHQHDEFKPEYSWMDYSSIKIYYLNETDKGQEKMYLYTVPTCAVDQNCTMNRFRTAISDLLLDYDTYDLECGLEKPKVEDAHANESDEVVSESSTIIVLVSVIINLLLTLVFACRKRN